MGQERDVAARTLPYVLLVGPIVGILWIALPHPDEASELGVMAAMSAPWLMSVALRAGATRPWSRPFLGAIVALATVSVSAAVYFTGVPGSGLAVLYLWVLPYAFMLFNARMAALQTLFMAVAYAVTLGLRAATDGDDLLAEQYATRWFVLVVTVVLVGVLVRTLTRALQESDSAFRRGFQRATVGVAVMSQEGTVLAANPALCRMLGRDAEELIGTEELAVTHPDDHEATRAFMARVSAGRAIPSTLEKRFVRPDGRVVWATVHSTVLPDEQGRPRYLFTQIEDTTERRRATRALAERARLDAAAAELGRFALQVTDLRAVMERAVELLAEQLGASHAAVLELEAEGGSLRIAASIGWREAGQEGATIPIAGTTAGEALRGAHTIVIDEVDTGYPASELLRSAGLHSGVCAPIRRPGRHFGVLAVHDAQPRRFGPEHAHFVDHVANVLSAALQRNDAEEQARYHALHDHVTGLPNRPLFLDRLQRALERADVHGNRVAVLALDLDGFKLVNESLGHSVGDAVLEALAPRIQQTLGPADTVAHLGADEFVVFCEDQTDERAAVELAARLIDAVSRPISIGGDDVFVTAGIGLAISSGHGASAERLLREADGALARAKDHGHGRVELFEDAMHERARSRLSLKTGLRFAVDRGEMLMHYQPVVNTDDGRIGGAEGLVRWRHPRLGLIAPDRFIPVAEESGLIVPIGRWVLERACRDAVSWRRRDRAPVHIGVNVSAVQLRSRGFVEDLRAIVRDTGVDPRLLNVELTESVLMGAEAAGILPRLKDLGVQLVLDDFGTGYSSLGYLKRFPLDALKIDRAFVTGADGGLADEPIIRAILAITESLGMAVVAEGVETPGQLEALRELGCGLVQGHHLGRPMPTEQLDARLAHAAASAA